MDLRHQIGLLRRWTWLLVAGVLLGGAIAYLVSTALPKLWEAKATLLVGQSLTAVNPDYDQLLTSQRLSQTYALVATTRLILERVIQSEGLEVSADDLAKRVNAVAPRDSTVITIIAQDRDPERSAAIANGVATQLLAASPAIQGRQADVQEFVDEQVRATQRQITDAQAELDRLDGLPTRTPEQDQQIQALQNRLVTMRAAYGNLLSFSSNSASSLLSVIEPAVPPEVPSSPRIIVNTVLAALVGLLLAAGVAFGVELLDDTLKTPEDVEQITQLPTLGRIVRMPGDEKRSPIYRLATLVYPRSAAAEAYRSLRTNVEFTSVDMPLTRLLVTSSVPGEGKTTTASNLAVAFAQTGRRTLLIDADLRRPGVHKLMDLANDRGLTDILRNSETEFASVAQTVEQPDLWVITSGSLPPNPAELLASNKMQTLLESFNHHADLVILDSPPLQAVTDAAILSSMVDGTLVVAHAGRTRREALRRGLETLDRVGAHVIGVALNGIPQRTHAGYDHRYYGADPQVDDTAERVSERGKRVADTGTHS